MAELTHEQLADSCVRNNLTAFICGQDYWATLEDTKDNDVAEEDKKSWVMSNMLQENLNYRDLEETDDEDDDSELHSERMAARDDILCKVVDKWVAGEYTGKDKPELELAQDDVDKAVADYFGGKELDGGGAYLVAYSLFEHFNQRRYP